jgi:hypothetical protein
MPLPGPQIKNTKREGREEHIIIPELADGGGGGGGDVWSWLKIK